jgi:hypothetical protein
MEILVFGTRFVYSRTEMIYGEDPLFRSSHFNGKCKTKSHSTSRVPVTLVSAFRMRRSGTYYPQKVVNQISDSMSYMQGPTSQGEPPVLRPIRLTSHGP